MLCTILDCQYKKIAIIKSVLKKTDNKTKQEAVDFNMSAPIKCLNKIKLKILEISLVPAVE